jgi:hypothetical protein
LVFGIPALGGLPVPAPSKLKFGHNERQLSLKSELQWTQSTNKTTILKKITFFEMSTKIHSPKFSANTILEAFEWRKIAAQKTFSTEGWCPMKRKGKEGTKRAHEDSAYAALRTLCF